MESNDAYFEFYEDKHGEYRWRLVAANGRIMADSAEGYTTEAHAKRAQERFVVLVGTASIEEVKSPDAEMPGA